MQKKKSVWMAAAIGFLLGAVLFGGTVAVAAGVLANQTSSKVTVDGRAVSVGAYNIGGSNYFKLRDFCSAVNIGVWFDSKSNSIHIETDKKYDVNYAGPGNGQAAGYSRTNPAPIGTEQTVGVDNYLEKNSVKIKVTEVVRGEAAWKLIQAANMFNSAPADGKEYLLAKISANVLSSKDDKAVSFSAYSFSVFSGKNVEYPTVLVVAPKPQFSGSVYVGGTLEGYAVYQVDKADSTPKAVYGENYDGTGGIWFKLY